MTMRKFYEETDQRETFFYMKGDAVIGTCRQSSDGWRFMPMISGRKVSKRDWPSASACIPRWARLRMGTLVTHDEFKRRTV